MYIHAARVLCESISVSVVSSTHLWVGHDDLKPSINTMNEKGPSHDPWGILPFRVSQDDKRFPVFTRCCRLIRKDQKSFLIYSASLPLCCEVMFSFWNFGHFIAICSLSGLGDVFHLLLWPMKCWGTRCHVSVDIVQVLEFVRSREQFLDRVLYHLGTSAIMDLLLRLITSMEPTECRTSCVQVIPQYVN